MAATLHERGRFRVDALGVDEAEPATGLLARAFRDNPLNVAVIGGSPARRVRANAAGLRGQVARVRARGMALGARAGGPLVGVLLAEPPFARPAPPQPFGARLRVLLGQGPRVAQRWAEVYETLLRVEPPQPFWYLAALGVEPALQGRGAGSELLGVFLARVDERAERAALETDRAENLPLYRRAGFAVTDELRIRGVPVWVLERPARTR